MIDFACGAFTFVGMVCSGVGVLILTVFFILMAQGVIR